jgi:2-polyprenyl-3-methyl-5-hydroxy-6-metoxy-1,4-benzoquinol methylase
MKTLKCGDTHSKEKTMESKRNFSEDGKRVLIDDIEKYIESQDEIHNIKDDLRHVQRNKDVIDEALKIDKDIKKVLDIGCREALTQDLCEELGLDFLGVDISKISVDFAKSKGRNVMVGDAHELSSVVSNKHDLILSVHSLEHCYDPGKVIEECKKCLSDNGILGIRVPIQKSIDNQPAHFSIYSPASLISLLEDNDFTVKYTQSIRPGNKYEEFIIIGVLN